MFSVQLFIVVAGVLLMSDTNQAKVAVRQSGSTTYNQTQLLRAARVENENATRILNDTLIPRYPELWSTRDGLMQALKYLDKLLQEKVKDRVATFTMTLDSELAGFFGSTICTELSECNQTYTYVQQATGSIIGAILKENTVSEEKKMHIRNIIKGNITEEGVIEEGASLLQTYEVAVKVWFCLKLFCKPN